MFWIRFFIVYLSIFFAIGLLMSTVGYFVGVVEPIRL